MNDTNVLSYCSMNLSLPGLSLAHQLYVAVKVCLLELELPSSHVLITRMGLLGTRTRPNGYPGVDACTGTIEWYKAKMKQFPMISCLT